MDAWELRRLNLRAPSDPGPMGQEIVPTEGASRVAQGAGIAALGEARQAAREHAGAVAAGASAPRW